MIIIVRSWSILIFLEKESGVCRLECFIVFQGILFELGKTVRILSRIFKVYFVSWVLENLRILSYTPRMPIRIWANSVANVSFCAVQTVGYGALACKSHFQNYLKETTATTEDRKKGLFSNLRSMEL